MPPGALAAFCAAGRSIRPTMLMKASRTDPEITFVANIPGKIRRIL